ncbi:MAG: protein kinase [Alphaproteobacteria bacterium]|nr:protein kinase [Alphaproteobacteria bacterium]
MAYAHAQGVVHRDLKPSNIMFGAYGAVHVVDWGLAKLLSTPSDAHGHVSGGGSANLTRVGSISGTPLYMAPEQARGDADAAGPAADVHALGRRSTTSSRTVRRARVAT